MRSGVGPPALTTAPDPPTYRTQRGPDRCNEPLAVELEAGPAGPAARVRTDLRHESDAHRFGTHPGADHG